MEIMYIPEITRITKYYVAMAHMCDLRRVHFVWNNATKGGKKRCGHIYSFFVNLFCNFNRNPSVQFCKKVPHWSQNRCADQQKASWFENDFLPIYAIDNKQWIFLAHKISLKCDHTLRNCKYTMDSLNERIFIPCHYTLFLWFKTLTLQAPPSSGTHHLHSALCPLMERAWG